MFYRGSSWEETEEVRHKALKNVIKLCHWVHLNNVHNKNYLILGHYPKFKLKIILAIIKQKQK